MWNSAGLMIARPWVRAPLVPTCLCPWARYLVSIASLTWAYQGGIGRGKYYNLSANKVCTWPVAPLGEAKWLWRFPWYRNNRQQRFVSYGKRRYTNADIIIIIIILERSSIWNPKCTFFVSTYMDNGMKHTITCNTMLLSSFNFTLKL